MTEEIGPEIGHSLKDATYKNLTHDEPFQLIDHNEFVKNLLL